MFASSDLRARLAPSGALRAAINLGNPILARPGDPEPQGISVDIARELARRLGVDLVPVVHDSARASVAAVRSGAADIGFFAVDPGRSDGVAFTDPYLCIEGGYLVRDGSPIHAIDEVDRAGVTVAVGHGSAYDLFLTRHLRAARIERAPTSPGVVDFFLERGLEVAAGVRQQLAADLAKHAGLRALPGSFMTIRQAMGVPESSGAEVAGFVREFVRDIASSGLVGEFVKRNHVEGVEVFAP